MMGRLRNVCVLCAGILAGCGHRPDPSPTPIGGDGPETFTFAYTHSSPILNFTVAVGVWMHKAQRLDREAIADWLAVPYEGKRLLEPINVLWIDTVAKNEQDAIDGLVDFLRTCGFRREGDVLGQIPRHSSGYSASYGGNVWRQQYDPDDAWVQAFLGGQLTNNHGRIFPSFALSATGGRSAFLTLGAFSREGPAGNPFILGVDCLLKRENCHPFRSFDQARNELDCGVREWRVSGPFDFRNRYPLSLGLSFSTADHSGVLVFERAG
jgi:hypothetical protein